MRIFCHRHNVLGRRTGADRLSSDLKDEDRWRNLFTSLLSPWRNFFPSEKKKEQKQFASSPSSAIKVPSMYWRVGLEGLQGRTIPTPPRGWTTYQWGNMAQREKGNSPRKVQMDKWSWTTHLSEWELFNLGKRRDYSYLQVFLGQWRWQTGHGPRVVETSGEELLSITGKKLINILYLPALLGKEVLKMTKATQCGLGIHKWT